MNTLKNYFALACAALILTFAGVASAQMTPKPVTGPRPSQKATVAQTIGVTDVTITYSRPGVKGRRIWGDAPAPAPAAPAANAAPATAPAPAANSTATLDDARTRPADAPIVAYGHVWRTGANEATTFTVSDEVLINGQKLAAGTYSLHTIPGRDEWTIIFNSDPGQWGSFSYDAAKDVLRVKAKPQATTDNEEWLSFSIPEVGATTARVVLRWEKVSVPFTVDVPSVETAFINRVRAAMAANPSDWQSPLNVAGFYIADKKWDQALTWVDLSIKAKPTFGNLQSKSNILFNAGRKDESYVVADQAIQQGKADKADTSAFERRIADRKAGRN